MEKEGCTLLNSLLVGTVLTSKLCTVLTLERDRMSGPHMLPLVLPDLVHATDPHS
jgi:hypothetical protein